MKIVNNRPKIVQIRNKIKQKFIPKAVFKTGKPYPTHIVNIHCDAMAKAMPESGRISDR